MAEVRLVPLSGLPEVEPGADRRPAFVGFGVSLQVLALLGLVTYFKRRGWF